MRHRDRDGGLADASRADDGDEARGGQPTGECENIVGAPDYSVPLARKVGAWKIGRDGRVVERTVRRGARRYEAVAPPRKGHDVAGAILAIPDRPSQAIHVE